MADKEWIKHKFIRNKLSVRSSIDIPSYGCQGAPADMCQAIKKESLLMQVDSEVVIMIDRANEPYEFSTINSIFESDRN